MHNTIKTSNWLHMPVYYYIVLLVIKAYNLQQRTQLVGIKIFHISRSATDYAITLNIVNYRAINANISKYAHFTRTHIK